MLSKVRSFARRNGLFSPGDEVCLAVSGGADSMALLHCMAHLAPSLGLQLTVLHLNHCIRGEEARADAEFVSSQADSLDLRCVVERRNVPALARRKGISIEMAAREARFRFFARVARESGASSVATAHTADDQAETLLLRLARGAGTSGLGGIRPHSIHHGMRVVHPMLTVIRAEVIAFLKRRAIEWREDSSNEDTAFLRNRVRHEILPTIERLLNPSVRSALCRSAEIRAAEDDWMGTLVSDIYTDCCIPGKKGIEPDKLVVSRLSTQPKAARRRVILSWLQKVNAPAEYLSFDVIERVDKLVRGRKGSGSVPIFGTLTVAREYDSLLWKDEGTVIHSPGFDQQLANPGETLINDYGLRVTVNHETGILRQVGSKPGMLPAWASINAATVGRRKLKLRSWRAGDRIRPMGVPGSKKLQDIFVDAKIPASQRCSIPVLECSGTIVWIPGYRVARGWEVPSASSPALHIRIERI